MSAFDECKKAYTLARSTDELFETENYKWQIGYNVIFGMSELYNHMIMYPDERKTLFGIEMEIDVINKDNIRLWKRVY